MDLKGRQWKNKALVELDRLGCTYEIEEGETFVKKNGLLDVEKKIEVFYPTGKHCSGCHSMFHDDWQEVYETYYLDELEDCEETCDCLIDWEERNFDHMDTGIAVMKIKDDLRDNGGEVTYNLRETGEINIGVRQKVMATGYDCDYDLAGEYCKFSRCKSPQFKMVIKATEELPNSKEIQQTLEKKIAVVLEMELRKLGNKNNVKVAVEMESIER